MNIGEGQREQLLQDLMAMQRKTYDLSVDSMSWPYRYGKIIVFQAEREIIGVIAEHPGITITELGQLMGKTASACSQMVRKLREKGLVEQSRDLKNNRKVHLVLTETGKRVYEDYADSERGIWEQVFQMLENFTETELKNYLCVHEKIAEAYQESVKRSRGI